MALMRRHFFEANELRLSYLDSEGPGFTLIALHSHWLEGHTFAALAERLAPGWRVVALDQRGHGFSDHARDYSREAYLCDLDLLFQHLDCGPSVLLGNSLGGVNAYQFAKRRPSLVRGLVIEDIGVEIHDDTSIAKQWEGTFGTWEELEERTGSRLFPYLCDSIRSVPGGWRLAFSPDDMLASQQQVNGDHWDDWLASDCPALVLRGDASRVTQEDHLMLMAERRPHTSFRQLSGGHVLHVDNLDGVANAVIEFLRQIS